MEPRYSQSAQLRTAVTFRRRARFAASLGVAAALTAYSAMVAKDLVSSDTQPQALSLLQFDDAGFPATSAEMATPPQELAPNDPLMIEPTAEVANDTAFLPEPVTLLRPALPPNAVEDLSVRVFDGRIVRPVKTMWMVVTAYSPDERSCAGTADNITASNHHVLTNAHRLVAADSRVLPLGSMISIPGYDRGQIVPVLDRGGAIKGSRLDVLFPTHEQALVWGVRRVKITVWAPADGGGKTDWRSIRDSRASR